MFDLRTRRDLLSRRLWRGAVRRTLRVVVLLAGDIVAAAGASYIAPAVVGEPSEVMPLWRNIFPLVLTLTLLGQAAANTYGPERLRTDYQRVLAGTLAVMAALLGLDAAYSVAGLTLTQHLVLGTALGVLACGVRVVADLAVQLTYRRGVGVRRILVIGAESAARELAEHFRRAGKRGERGAPGVQIVGHVAPDGEQDAVALGGLDRLGDIIEHHDVDSVIISAQLDSITLRSVLRTCFVHGAAASIVPATISRIACRVSGWDVLGWPLLELEVPHLHTVQVILKRTLDVVLAAIAIAVLAPVLVAVAVAVKLDTPGPVLFRQRRLGVGGRPFTMYKFRSMRADAEQVLKADRALYQRYVENGYKLPPDEDPRISRLGAFLRRTSLDELPQLFNVLRGNMSLVGPRPIVPPEIKEYGEHASVFLGVKPGVTGYWQISGRSAVGYPERVDLDIHYVTTWWIGLDLKIVFRTIPAVLKRQGAH